MNKLHIEKRLDGIFEFIINISYYNKDYELINSMLNNIDVNKWSEEELIGFLTITSHIKEFINVRPKFYFNVFTLLVEKYGINETNDILRGLI